MLSGKALIDWVDYIHPGNDIPPIADPDCFLEFAKTHEDGQRSEDWQNAEFHGDKVFGSAVSQVLKEWNFYGPFMRLCYHALTSNTYCRRVAVKFNLLDLCIGEKNKKNVAGSFPGDGLADVFEVRPTFLSPHAIK